MSNGHVNGRLRAPGRVGAPERAHDKTFMEFFAGIGLVEEGLRPLGWQSVYANDVDEQKRQMHEIRNGPCPHYQLEDVGNTDAVVANIPGRPFLATASFPCIDLSLAGHFKGFEGRHSSTFFGFADVLKKLDHRRPKLVMLENVLGFLSSRGGEDFRAALRSLADLGYWFDALILDASHFVPQSRPRVFVVGMASDVRPTPAARGLWPDAVAHPRASRLRPAALVSLLGTPAATGWWPLTLPEPPQRRLALHDVIDLDDGQEWWTEVEVQRHYKMMSDRHRERVNALLASRSAFVGTIFRRVRRDGQRAEVRFDGLAGCLRTPRGGSGRQIVLATDAGRLRLRWMSPREYARLQGVPDFPLALPTNRLLLGFADAVCVPAIAWIDQHILTPLHAAAQPGHRNGHARQPQS